VTPEEDALVTVIDALDRLSIPYMLTGSVASSYHGRPRSTHDADIVIDPTPATLDALVSQLTDAGFYINSDGAREAIRRRRAFNAIDGTHGCKIDLIPRRDRAFSQEEFRRRIIVDLSVRPRTAVVTAEDAVLSKLEWARLSGDSERQLTDAASIVALNPEIDRGYVQRWASELGVLDLWERIAGPTKP
jgi:hypothetical protein